MNKLLLAFSICASTLYTGCTTQLQTRQEGYAPYIKTPGGEQVEIGSSYGLPMLQFKLLTQRTLLQCANEDGTTNIRFQTKVDVTPVYVVGERFSLDSEAMTGWSKTSRLAVDSYDSGVLKSLNASAEDHTKAIVGNVVKSGVSILSLVSGVPLDHDEAALVASTYVCAPNTLTTLREIDTNTDKLATHSEQLVALNDEVARLEGLASKGALTEEGKKQLDQAQKDRDAKAKAVKQLDQTLATLTKRVSVSEEIIWPRSPRDTTLNAPPNPRNRAALYALFALGQNGIDPTQLASTFEVKGRLAPVFTPPSPTECKKDTALCSNQEQVKAGDGEGLMFREPVAARLLICEVADVGSCNVDAASGVIASNVVMAPQLGKLRMLPFRNGVFQHNELQAVFRENGSLASFSYDEKNARGAELASALSDGLDQVVSYRDARQAAQDKKAADALARNKADQQAVLDELDNRIAVLQKTQQLNQLNAEISENGTLADMKTETARLNARIALLEAQRQTKAAEQALAEE